MSSSVPDFSLEAQKWLDYAKESLRTESPDKSPTQDDLALAQTNATIGLGYAVLATVQSRGAWRLPPRPVALRRRRRAVRDRADGLHTP